MEENTINQKKYNTKNVLTSQSILETDNNTSSKQKNKRKLNLDVNLVNTSNQFYYLTPNSNTASSESRAEFKSKINKNKIEKGEKNEFFK